MSFDYDFIFNFVLIGIIVWQIIRSYTLQSQIEILANSYTSMILELVKNGNLSDPKFKMIAELYNELKRKQDESDN